MKWSFSRKNMQIRFFVFAIVSMVLFTCTPNSQTIEYLNNAEEMVHPELWKIYAATENIIFLHGHLKENSKTISTLFISENGGGNWKEVYRPLTPTSEKMSEFGGIDNIGISDSFEFSFLASGSGWLISNWGAYTYGAVAITIEHTSDFGKTWVRLSEITPSPQYEFLQASFSDEKHGQISILYENTLNDRIAFFTTMDGGITWVETGSLNLREAFWDGNNLHYYNAIEAYVNHYYFKHPHTTSFNNYLWKLDYQENPSRIFIQKSSSGNSWDTIATFP